MDSTAESVTASPKRSDSKDAESKDLRECRICLLSETPEDLVQPCGCNGSVKWAHMGCLKQWCNENLTLKCELCGQVYRPNVVAELLPILQDAQAAQARQNADRMATDFPGMPHGGMDERRRAFDAIIIDGLRNPHHDPRRTIAGHPMGMGNGPDSSNTGLPSTRMRRYKWATIFWIGFLSFPLYWLVSAKFDAKNWGAPARIGMLVIFILVPVIPFVLARVGLQVYQKYLVRRALAERLAAGEPNANRVNGQAPLPAAPAAHPHPVYMV